VRWAIGAAIGLFVFPIFREMYGLQSTFLIMSAVPLFASIVCFVISWIRRALRSSRITNLRAAIYPHPVPPCSLSRRKQAEAQNEFTTKRYSVH
jgi:predicted lipid-binding transport protein (Tim44 family)